LQFRHRGSRHESAVAQLFSLGGYTFMKNTLIVLLSGLLLCGCSQKQASSAGSAIDLVQAGKDTVWQDGATLHIAKRDGASIEGIQIVKTSADGKKTTMTADTGTISSGSIEDTADANSVKLTLHDARGETLAPAGKKVMTMKELILVLKR
jgi:hypothetical protein